MDKMEVYQLLVNRVPGIRQRYQKMREKGEKGGRAKAALYLIGLNISYYVFRNKKLETLEKFPYYEKKELYAGGSESSLSKMQEPSDFAEELSASDIISFDVFDTLIFRPFSEPADLFFVMENNLSYPDFKNLRERAESEARRRKAKKEGHREITIEEIYEILEEETGLKGGDVPLYEKEVGLEAELGFANPYMLKAVKALKKKKKRLIITSDMYLKKEHIAGILKEAGYPDFDAYYISCEHSKSKSAGDLYELVKETEKEISGIKKDELSFAHVGDNAVSDIEHAKEHGFAAFHTENVNKKGAAFRPDDMSSITGSLYRGIVNSHIHNGLREFSREYEYGYIYGGLFVSGYVRFVHDYVHSNNIEKVLFLSRDGDILKQVWDKFYPEEKNTEYVYWSRLAAAKLAAGRFKADFIRRFVNHKVNQKISFWKIFESMDLSFMLEGFCDAYMKETENGKERVYSPDDFLTDKNMGDVQDYLSANWQQVIDSYEDQRQAGRQYYSQVLSGVKSAAAVDIGWAGSGAITLNYMVNEVWALNCPVTGIIAGTNTCHNTEPDFSETFLQSGKLVSYLYSQRENRDIWKFHDPGKKHNLYLEMLTDAPSGSLKGFYLKDRGEFELKFKQDSNDKKKVLEIQKGILDFASDWKLHAGKTGGLDKISGRDAYAPFVIMESAKNSGFMKNIAGTMDEMGI